MKKILHTIYIGLLALAATTLTCTSCVDDDLMGNKAEVVEGEPITISLNFAAIPSTDVSITRASGSDLSDLSDIVICVFHGDGSFEQMVTNYEGGGLTVNGNSVGDNGERRYSVSFESTSGEKKLIALANVADGAFWENMITELEAAFQAEKHFDDVKAIVADVSHKLVTQSSTIEGMQPFHVTSSSQMLISGWNEDVVFGTNNAVTDYGTYGDANNQVAIKMQRAMAHITFNIAANPTGANGMFTPASFRVYNIPTKSYLTNGISETLLTTGVAITDEEYVNTASENIGTAQGDNYSFDFYMPENVQEGKTVNAYNDRDVWTGDPGTSAEDKTWTNAPQNSTFVVISGTYEGNATIAGNQGQPVTANVEYTIHLGDFSTAGSMGNFSVERNYSYTYNVKVLGVDNIIVEAQKDGGENPNYQNGAEGSVYDNAHTVYSYNLDAHYEQVYLEYNLSDIASSLTGTYSDEELDNAIANQLILIIQSEAMDYTHEETENEPYTTRNKRGTLSPYKIYADAVRNDTDAAAAKAAVLDGAGTGITPTKGFDYKWIEFLPQVGTTIAAYPGMSSWARESLEEMANSNFYEGNATENAKYLMDVYDVIVGMGKKVKELYLSQNKNLTVNTGSYPLTAGDIMISQNTDGDYVARFTAFVNEYYYLRHPLTGMKATSWSVMTNKVPREMIIAMSTETSTDGNSSYSKIHSYISQLAMQTFYNDRVSSLNAFGIETYNETPLYEFGFPNSTSNLSDTDGRENQKILIGVSSSPNWSTYITASSNGWTKSVGTDHLTHKLTDAAYSTRAAYSACMSRNRDLNGDGKIDENEIRWFLPSINGYIRMGIGANALSSAAKLYLGDKTTMTKSGYPTDYVSDGALYYTSSESNKRVYWAIEKGSYNSETPGGNWYTKRPLPIRCIRTLPATSSTTDVSSINGVKSDATYKYYANLSPKLLVFKDRLVLSLYRQGVTSSLSVHNEDDNANSFYDGIFVASNFLPTTYTLGDIIGYNGYSWINPCSLYSEDGYTNWRVPNLVELSAMNAAGLLAHSGSDVACCTQFSNQNVRYGFAYSSLIYCLGNNGTELNNRVLIRCVRDVPPGYTFPTN